MDYANLRSFLLEKMRMSHIYQPVMIKRLLEGNGSATDNEIAAVLVNFDPSQLEYYKKITNNMVGKVLRSHHIVNKERNQYKLADYESLRPEQKTELINLCSLKIDDYIKRRKDAIWAHRRTNRNNVPGTVRYEVLKRAQFRCELCGISANEKALEVDHITPKNLGGIDSINNYQALCYTCNASKRDRDNTDFRETHNKYACRDNYCIFCIIDKKRIVNENNLAYLIYDKFPVTDGHSLIIPKRHFPDYFEITQAEVNSVNSLLHQAKDFLQKEDKTIEAFNIGINSGLTAGQTILHTHIHLIPRRKHDVENPRGGIRNLIAGKGDYIS
jgi:ATP adenylyltransferase